MVIVSQSPRSNGRLLNVPCNPFCCTSKQSACKATNCKSSKSLGVHSNLLLDLLLLLCRGLLFPFYHVASKEPKEILFLRAIAACDQQISNPQHMRTFYTYLIHDLGRFSLPSCQIFQSQKFASWVILFDTYDAFMKIHCNLFSSLVKYFSNVVPTSSTY